MQKAPELFLLGHPWLRIRILYIRMLCVEIKERGLLWGSSTYVVFVKLQKERLAIQQSDVQVALADEIGLDHDIFLENIQNGKAENAFRKDLAECF